MSKKKQFSGKKTKLAHIPLTKALARRQRESEVAASPPVPPSGPVQPGFSWESLEQGAAGLLTAAYLLMVQDLLNLKKEVPWASEEEISLPEITPDTPLPAHSVREALRQAKQDLLDLSRLLAPSK